MTKTIRKILLVDDEPDIRRIAQISLEKVGGWSVVLAGSAREALALAGPEQPDVILLDVMMPVMDGPMAFTKLREAPETASIPVIFMTAKAQIHEVAELRASGAAGVIPKPFDPISLPNEVRRLVQA